MDLTGYLTNVSFSYKTGRPMLSFEIEQRGSAEKAIDSFLNVGRLTIKVDKYRDRRSLDANKYLWVLCGLIADKLSEEKPHTKEEIYQRAIKARGIYREQGELSPDFSKTMRTAWERLGTGWVTEQVDFEPDGERVIVRFYYGSSTYNSKQMSRVIDWLVEECRELQIETKSEAEIRSLVNQWEGKL